MSFIKETERIGAFIGPKDEDSILLILSAQIIELKFILGGTCLFIDEIQDCPEARTLLKLFKEDGRFDVIAIGSLLGVHGYSDELRKRRRKKVQKKELDINSVPVATSDLIHFEMTDSGNIHIYATINGQERGLSNQK